MNKKIIQKYFIIFFLLSLYSLAEAGKPFEVEYPNIIRPTVQFGSYGSKTGFFNEVKAIAFNDQNEIFIADCFNRRIQVFDINGIFLRVLSDSKNFNCPQGLAIAPDGRIFISDSHDKILVFDKNGKFKYSFGSHGRESGQLNNPTHLAIYQEQIYVTDERNYRIQVFSLSGDFKFSFGEYGSNPGQFNIPRSVTVDNKGFSYIVDNMHRVQKFDPNGHFIKQWGEYGGYAGSMAEPSDISFAGNYLFVADLVNHRLQIFNTEGEFIKQWGRHPEEMHEGLGRTHYPSMVKSNPSGTDVIVCEPFEYRCQIFKTAAIHDLPYVNNAAWWEKYPKFHYGGGARIARKNSTMTLKAMTIDKGPQEVLIITEPDIHRVVAFDISDIEKLKPMWYIGSFGSGPGKWGMLSAKTTLKQGTILVGDAGNNVIQKFDLLTGKYVKTVIEPKTGSANNFNGPSDAGEAPNGDLYIGDYHNNRIQVYDKDFKFKFSFGKTGGGKGEFFNPMSPVFNETGDKLFVSDTGNNRIQVFSLKGEYLYEFGRRAMPGEFGNGTFLNPFDVAISPNNEVYVTDPALQLVQKFSEDGKFLMQWGGWGTQPGQFYKCKGIAVDSMGRVFVIDFGNHRGQIFDRNGKFLGIFGEGILYPAAVLKPDGTLAVPNKYKPY